MRRHNWKPVDIEAELAAYDAETDRISMVDIEAAMAKYYAATDRILMLEKMLKQLKKPKRLS